MIVVVSIPSSSGLRLEQPVRGAAGREGGVSIPSSSGLRLEPQLVWHNRRWRVSQSLLHQVCGWNMKNMLKKAEDRGLNPFFIRSAVGTTSGGRSGGAGRVSIPSSSGLRLELDALIITDILQLSQSLLHQVCGWNCRRGSTGSRGWSQSLLHQVCGWNPIEKMFLQHVLRLNPFFIRSAVGTKDQIQVRRPWLVSIPSSSGLRLEPTKSTKIERAGSVSIPSSSGLRLERVDLRSLARAVWSQSLLHQVCGWNRRRCELEPEGHVSIPSSSGLRLEPPCCCFLRRNNALGRGLFHLDSSARADSGRAGRWCPQIGSRRMAERDSARKTVAAKRHWPSRCQQRICADVVRRGSMCSSMS